MIKKEDDKLVIENPGSIRTGKKQMLRGGISDPRNKTLMKMFNRLVLVKEPVVVSQIFIRFGRMKAGQCLL